MSRRPRIAVGDVFRVPLGDRCASSGVGQVVERFGRSAYYFAIFDSVLTTAGNPSDSEILGLLDKPIVLIALSLDGKLHAGHWAVIGHAAVADDVPLPAYRERVGGPARVDVVDYSGTRRRPASAEEARNLPDRTVVSPALVELALRALHGSGEWSEMFDELRPEGRLTTMQMFEQ